MPQPSTHRLTDRSKETTEINCPGCGGVLSLVPESGTDHVHFTCTVGHSFSLQTLLVAKEEQLEHDLWGTVALLRHIDMIGSMLLAQTERSTLRIKPEGLQIRIRQANEHARAIRTI